MTELRRRLERVEVPEEHEARARAWSVAEAAFRGREPVPRRTRVLWPAVAFATAAVVFAAAATSPGRAVIHDLREAVAPNRVEPSRAALFTLPARGRLLITSTKGAWIVHAAGSRRFLGDYEHATWSPRGLFVGVTRDDEIAAVDPKGKLRWSLPRPRVSTPRWAPSGFRVAYASGNTLRVVAGDGTGDAWLARGVDPAAPAWRPGPAHALAYGTNGGDVALVDVDRRTTLWTSPGRGRGRVLGLEWSRDGSLLLVRTRRWLRVLAANGRPRFDLLRPPAAPIAAASFAPNGRSVAFVQTAGGRSSLWSIPRLRLDGGAARRVFAGAGRFTDVEFSPDGRWLLLPWETADQLLFIRSAGVRKVVAVSNVSRQFDDARERPPVFPRVEGWCCA